MKASGQEVSTSDRSQSPTDDSMTRKKIPKKLWHQGCCVERLGHLYDDPFFMIFLALFLFVGMCLLLGCDLSNIIESQAISEFLWWKQIFLKWVDNGISNNLPNSSRDSLRVVKAFRKFCLVAWCCPCFLAQDPSWVGCGRAASVLWVGGFDAFCRQTWNQSLRFFAVCIAKMHVCHPLISITWFLNTTPASFAPNRLIFYLWSTLESLVPKHLKDRPRYLE